MKRDAALAAIVTLGLGGLVGWWLPRAWSAGPVAVARKTSLPDLRRTPPPADPKAVGFLDSAAIFSHWREAHRFQDAVLRQESLSGERLSPAVRALAEEWANDAMVRLDAGAALDSTAGALAVRALLGDGAPPDWDRLCRALETHDIGWDAADGLARACTESEDPFAVAERVLAACRVRSPDEDGIVEVMERLLPLVSEKDPKGTLAWLDRVDAANGTSCDRCAALTAYARQHPAAADAIAMAMPVQDWPWKYWAVRSDTDLPAVARAIERATEDGFVTPLQQIIKPVTDEPLHASALALLPTEPVARAEMIDWLRKSVADSFDARELGKMKHVFTDEEWQRLALAVSSARGFHERPDEEARTDDPPPERTRVSWEEFVGRTAENRILFSLQEMAKDDPGRAARWLEEMPDRSRAMRPGTMSFVAVNWAIVDADAALSWLTTQQESGAGNAARIDQHAAAAFAEASVPNLVKWIGTAGEGERTAAAQVCFDYLVSSERFDKASEFLSASPHFGESEREQSVKKLAAARAESARLRYRR